MDRTAEIINLRDVKNLEITKRLLERAKSNDIHNINVEIKRLSTPNLKNEIKVDEYNNGDSFIVFIYGAFIFSLLMVVWALVGLVVDPPTFGNEIAMVVLGLIIFGAILVFSFFGILGDKDEKRELREKIEKQKAHNEKVKKYNASEKQRVVNNQPMIKNKKMSLEERKNYWDSEIIRVNELLQLAYDVNLIPEQYRRKLPAILYLYDFVNTSNMTLESALISYQIEEGIQRIESKLDKIIHGQMQLLASSERKEYQNQAIIDGNIKMLNRLQRVEANTSTAAQYAKINSSYAKTCAFYSSASFWKDAFK